MKIIGLIGAKSAGKTTAFDIIQLHVPDVVEITLASKLKTVCSQVFSVPRDHFDRQDVKEKDLKQPAYLNKPALEAIFKAFGHNQVDYNKFIRPHVGKVLTTPRKIAQYIGTEVLRAIDPNIHCSNAFASDLQCKLAVVTDMRFPNEFEFFKQNPEFYPLYIKNTAAESAASKDAHESESHLPNLAKNSIKVDNESTLEVYEKNLLTTLKNLGVI